MGKRCAIVMAIVCVGAFGLAAPAVADSTATTGPATSVTQDSAILNGVIDTSGSGSAFEFQYGTTAAYGEITSTTPVGSGLRAVSVTVEHLLPGTTYHFRVIVFDGLFSPSEQTTDGQDMSFTTASLAKPQTFGRTRLLTDKLRVGHGTVAMPFKCVGMRGSLCDGRISLSSRVKAGKHGHARAVKCASGRFLGSGGHIHIVRGKLAKRCQMALKASPQHRMNATLRAVFSTHQKPLHTGVTLAGS